jgi:hypothetical protein
MIAIGCIRIMTSNDATPTARAERWEKIRTVFICAIIIGGAGVLLKVAESAGNFV